MKKIIINGRFLIHRVTGVERYAREILQELDKLVKPGELIMAVPPDVKDVPEYQNIKIVRTGRFKNRIWEHVCFPKYVKKTGGIALNLCNVAPLPKPGVVCIHDVKIKASPQYFSRKFLIWYNLLFWNAAKRAKLILTVSEFSKSEIIKYYHVDSGCIRVIPNAWQHYLKTGYDENALATYHLMKDDYYFSMCSLEPNKNFKWIAEVARTHPEQNFAVAGSVNESVFADGLGFACPENMKLLGYVSDEEAKTLMRDCKAFLFPTFYEGFGIPPLEALSAGAKQVFVSDTDVMHEVFGESVRYVDPYRPESFDEGRPDASTADREEVLEKYSWKKSAEKLYKLFDEIRK